MSVELKSVSGVELKSMSDFELKSPVEGEVIDDPQVANDTEDQLDSPTGASKRIRCGVGSRQIRTVLWKNVKLMQRYPRTTCMGILAPIGLALLLVGGYVLSLPFIQNVQQKVYANDTQPITDLLASLGPPLASQLERTQPLNFSGTFNTSQLKDAVDVLRNQFENINVSAIVAQNKDLRRALDQNNITVADIEGTSNRTLPNVALENVTIVFDPCEQGFDCERLKDTDIETSLLDYLNYNGPLPIFDLDVYTAAHRGVRSYVDSQDGDFDQALRVLELVDDSYRNLIYLGELAFAPDIPGVRKVVQYLRAKFTFFGSNTDIKVYSNEEDAVNRGVELANDNFKDGRFWAAIIFDEYNEQAKKIRFTIRMNYTTIPTTRSVYNRFTVGIDTKYRGYYTSGFLSLQHGIQSYANSRFFLDGDEVSNVVPGSLGADFSNLEASNFTDLFNDLTRGIDTSKSTYGPGDLDRFVNNTRNADFAGFSGRLSSENQVFGSPFPTDEYDFNVFYVAAGPLMGIVTALSMMYPVSQLLKNVVTEKETRTKETMKIMGLKPWIIMMTWTITYFVPFTLVAFITAYLYSVSMFQNSDFTLLAIYIWIFNISCLAFALFVSNFFSSAKPAGIVGPILLFVMVLPRYIFFGNETEYSHGQIFAASLLSPTAYAFGIDALLAFEGIGQGVTWENYNDPTLFFSFADVLLVLFFDTALYFFLAWYAENTVPNTYGAAKPLWFLFLPSYWCPEVFRTRPRMHNWNTPEGEDDNDSFIEPVDDTELKNRTVRIRGLRKIFNLNYGICGKKQVRIAVRGLNLDLYSGQILSLLGHNGAGKTTSIGMLTGLLVPTQGDAEVVLKDKKRSRLSTDMTKLRHNMGVCPQHNVLFDRLTCYEHMYYYGILKGLYGKELREAAESMLELVGLSPKRDVYSSALSGGMKRKLSVAIALVGNSRLVFLDEPTTGMDPYSRRFTWELLRKCRKGRTIILTTHFMDEADVLGDRIAIMVAGKLRALGTALYLKTHFGVGYNLTVVKTAGELEKSGMDRDFKETAPTTVHGYGINRGFHTRDEAFRLGVPELVREIIPKAQLVSHRAGELSFQLPLQHTELFPKLFQRLDKHRNELSIGSYGVSMTTLEEVFIKIGHIDSVGPDGHEGGNEKMSKSLQNPESSNGYERESSNVSSRADSKTAMLGEEKKNDRQLSLGALSAPSNRPLSLTSEGHMKKGTHLAGGESKPAMLSPPTERNPVEETQSPSFLSTGYEATFGGAKKETRPTLSITSGECKKQKTRADSAGRANSRTAMLAGGVVEDHPKDILTPSVRGEDNCKKSPNDSRGRPGTRRQQKNPAKSEESREPAKYHIQMREMLRKRYNCAKRDPVGRFFEVLLPIILVALVMLTLLLNISPSGPELKLNTSIYDNLRLFTPEPYSTPSPPRNGFSNGVIERLKANGVDLQKEKYGITDSVNMSLRLLDTRFESLKFCAYVPDDTIYLEIPENWRNGFGSNALLNLSESSPNSTKLMPQLTILHNTTGYHALPSYYAEYIKAKLQSDTNDNGATFSVASHPLPLTARKSLELKAILSLFAALFLLIPFCYIPATFVVFIVKERYVQAKHLQLVSGVSQFIYWAGTYTWDLINYLIIIIGTMLVFRAYEDEDLTGDAESAFAVFTLFMLYGTATIPLSYAMSFMFENHTIAQISIAGALFVKGFLLVVTSALLDGISGTAELNKKLKFFYRFSPAFCFGEGLINMSLRRLKNLLLGENTSPWDNEVLGTGLKYLVAETVVFCLLVLFVEYRILAHTTKHIGKHVQTWLGTKPAPVSGDYATSGEDIDVQKERRRVLSQDGPTDDLVCIKELTKVYRGRGNSRSAITAVDRLCLGIPKGECFGFLGVNGAGKTTTIKMITGEIDSTSGIAYVKGLDCDLQRTEVRRYMGYCPQFDPLFDLMTAREHLLMYARIRGIQPDDISKKVNDVLETVGLVMYADIPAGTYSGGNKRKLSLGLALIGEPSVVFLDEPSSGMDPVSRRFMWDVIEAVAKDCCVILTTHSMEECEALCGRLGIMVAGKLQCLGSIQHLKNRFGKGYSVECKMSPKHFDDYVVFMKERFPGAAVVERLTNGILRFELPSNGINLADIFGQIEKNKGRLHVKDYSVSQTSLEQVFIQIAQNDGKKAASPSRDYSHQNDEQKGASIVEENIPEQKEAGFSQDVIEMKQGTVAIQGTIATSELSGIVHTV